MVESGKCPHCKEMGLLNYDVMEIGDSDDLFYPFKCDNCGCWNPGDKCNNKKCSKEQS